jgi:hypothetical protein
MYQCKCCHCGKLFDSENKRCVDCGECNIPSAQPDKLEKMWRERCKCCEHFDVTVDGDKVTGWCYMFEDFMPNCKQYVYEMSDADAHHALTGE